MLLTIRLEARETQSVLIRLIERAGLGRSNLQTLSGANASFWRAETGSDAAIIHPAWQRTEEPAPQALGNRGLVVGRVQRWKGPQVLCAALNLLGSRAPDFDWIGKDTPWDDCKGSTIAHLARELSYDLGRKDYAPTARASQSGDATSICRPVQSGAVDLGRFQLHGRGGHGVRSAHCRLDGSGRQ